ncbi:MAG: hypothetical protein JNK78_02770 [Planctomycetes bacterium]|nr:hypothetical protein [Planctomycetota bacterium]
MNRKTDSWWSNCVAGAVAALVVHGLVMLAAGGEPPLRPDPAPVPGLADMASLSARAGADAEALQRLAAEVAALREQLGRTAIAGAPERTQAAAPVQVVDDAALVAALRRVREIEEQERFAELSDAELYSEAERLLHAGKMDRLSGRRMLQSLLARPNGSSSPELRADTLMLLAQIQRDLRDYPAATAALQRVVDELGLASDRGARAGNQLALLASYTKDYPAGIALAEQIARVAPVDQAFEARWGIGFLQRMSGDLVAARATLRQVIDDCSGRPEVEHVAKMCENLLAQMDP